MGDGETSGARVTTYRVWWRVGTRRWKESFRTAAQADSFRSRLLTSVREGEAFDLASGRPISLVNGPAATLTWCELVCRYTDAKWAQTSPHHRKGTAEALTTATLALLDSPVDAARAKEIRSALLNWGYNIRRGSSLQPSAVTRQLDWVSRHSRPLTDLTQQPVLRYLLSQIAMKVDGTRAAGRTAAWKPSIISVALNHAVEDGLIGKNPITATSWKPARTVTAVDRRAVVNPDQARALLDAVRVTPRSGHRLVAFFATIYYSALRPEEAAHLRASNLDLPDEGWGWITLDGAAPEVDRHWSNSGQRREARELKHRAVGDSRRVPCPPALVALLKYHLQEYGDQADDRVFRGERGDALAGVSYTRLWARARRAALTPEQFTSPLAARPYDLRHAAVSTWLNSGVAPTQVAEWAGHSVAILLRIYAKCIDGTENPVVEPH